MSKTIEATKIRQNPIDLIALDFSKFKLANSKRLDMQPSGPFNTGCAKAGQKLHLIDLNKNVLFLIIAYLKCDELHALLKSN